MLISVVLHITNGYFISNKKMLHVLKYFQMLHSSVIRNKLHEKISKEARENYIYNTHIYYNALEIRNQTLKVF